jgi:hypothetical protein
MFLCLLTKLLQDLTRIPPMHLFHHEGFGWHMDRPRNSSEYHVSVVASCWLETMFHDKFRFSES